MKAAAACSLVLVIEGDEEVAKNVGSIIRENSFQTAICYSALRGIGMAHKLSPQAIILAQKLSRLDGFEVLKRLKLTPGTENIPVIILSSNLNPANRIRAFEMGADDYIIKPFNNRELVLRLKAVMRRYHPVVKTLSAGDLELDPIAMKVQVKGQRVEMALSEIKLLSVLLTNRGKIIPREELHKMVWGADTEVDIRSVDTYVYRVRLKLGDIGSMMKTIRGRGYVFQNPNS